MSAHRTTVAIPLHASAEHLEVVAGNVERLRLVADVVVSDATGVDDTLARLRERLGEDAATWRGPDPAGAGWVAHCNLLLAEARTEFFAWLPHDDEADADWVLAGEAALDAHPDAVAATGRVEPIGEVPGAPGFAMPDELGSPDAEARVRAGLQALSEGDGSALTVLFHGVLRRALTPALPLTEGDAWADTPWALEALVAGPVVRTDSTYRKSWDPGTASALWSPLERTEGFRDGAWVAAIRGLAPEARARVLAAAWETEARRLIASRDDFGERLELSRQEHEAVLASRTWRWGRSLAHVLRLGRPAR